MKPIGGEEKCKGREDHFSYLGVHGMITLRNILKHTGYEGVTGLNVSRLWIAGSIL